MTTLRCLRMKVQILIFTVTVVQSSFLFPLPSVFQKFARQKWARILFQNQQFLKTLRNEHQSKKVKKKGCSKGVQISTVRWFWILEDETGNGPASREVVRT